jgi:hypothetical protein
VILYLALVTETDVGLSFSRTLSGYLQEVLVLLTMVSIGLNKLYNRTSRRLPYLKGVAPWLPSLGMSFCVILAINPVLLSWLDSQWSYSKIGGALPWSDARGYYEGSFRLLNAEQLDSFNSRRPINAIMFAFRLLLSDGHLYWALVLQGLGFGLVFFLFLKELSKFVGVAGLMIACAVAYSFAIPFLDVTLSETLGLTLSLAAATSLLRFINNGKAGLFYFSILLLSLALSARSGPYFVLLLLVLCAPVIFATSHFQRLISLAVAALFSLAGTIYSTLLNVIYGSSALDQNGNFGYVLYGLAKGGLGWTAYQTDFTTQLFETDSELARAVFLEAIKSIIVDPTLFIKGLWLGLKTYLDIGFYGFVPGLSSYIFFTFFVLGWVVLSQKTTNPRLRNLSLVWFLGLLISIPFIFQDGGFRVTATGLPIFIVLPALGISMLEGSKRTGAFHATSSSDNQIAYHASWKSQILLFPPVFLACVAMLIIAVLPKFFDVGLVPDVSRKPHICNAQETPIMAELGPRQPAIFHSEINDSRQANSQTTAWYQAQVDRHGIEIADALRKIPSDVYLVEAMNQTFGRISSVFLLVSPKEVSDRPELRNMCGTPIDDPIGASYGIYHVRFIPETDEGHKE